MHVLVVGSSVIDLFLSVDENHVELTPDKVTLSLGDKIPSEIKKLSLGGNGSNISVGLTRLEIPTTFYTYIGGDILSREIQEGLTREGVKLEAQRMGGQTSISLIFDFDSDRIIFSHHERRDHTFEFKNDGFDYIFLNSIGDVWQKAYEQVLTAAKEHNIPLAFSPGIHQIENAEGVVGEVMKNSKYYFSNREEAEKITKLSTGTDIKELFAAIKKMGPQIISVTDGKDGAYATDEKNVIYKIGPAPTQGHEKTGAGDAYAAGFFAAVISGNDLPTAMSWGSFNSGGVMQQIGAQTGLLTKKALDENLASVNNLKAEQI